jgi:hypothetical protein
MRRRLIDALIAKARRGELRLGVPIGFVWERDGVMEIDPDRRIQQAIRTAFRLFDRLGSARQVLLRMRNGGLLFPRPEDAKSPLGRSVSDRARPTFGSAPKNTSIASAWNRRIASTSSSPRHRAHAAVATSSTACTSFAVADQPVDLARDIVGPQLAVAGEAVGLAASAFRK